MAGAGLVQAFVIALYAEMYGFPLTINLMVRLFGLDSANLDANLWATAVGVGALGMMVSMALGYTLLFVGIGIFMQGWRELYRARQENRLATGGLYALVRHPQYMLAYGLLARSEEKRVLEQFGDEYRAYRRRVPMFIPKIGQWGHFVERSGANANEQALPPR